jgi:predicted Abi (CAAX) family protease
LGLTLILGLSLVILTNGILIYYQLFKRFEKNKQSNYEIYSNNSLTIPQVCYSNQINLSPFYQPISSWTGRLILPQQQQQSDDFVFFKVHNADSAHQNLIGQTVRLQWSDEPQVQEYIQAVTNNVFFTQKTQKSKELGNLHPERLNNRQRVDPLMSLAGARPKDDVIVMLKAPVVVSSDGKLTSLIIAKEPVQITGSLYGLVSIINLEASDAERFIVRHFNKISKQFDGPLETIRIPQVTPDRNGVRRSTNRGIEKSPFNGEGWYIYGAKDADGIFVTQAIAPRRIMRLQPDEVRLGKKLELDYINQQNWKDTEAQKGTAKTVLLDPAAEQINDALFRWQEGDKAIVIHTYGGIGGKKAEPAPLGVVTGHFAYGIAQVVRDRLTAELHFDIEYQQVYAHNPDGIVAGAIKWSSFMGDLQRGWLGNRPVSDVIIKFDALTQDYDFEGIKLSPRAEFTRQLDIMMARYRIGDGTGGAMVTPATSCVQDSNQALYVTIKRIEEQVQSNPGIQEWLRRDHQADRRTSAVKSWHSRVVATLSRLRTKFEISAVRKIGAIARKTTSTPWDYSTRLEKKRSSIGSNSCHWWHL